MKGRSVQTVLQGTEDATGGTVVETPAGVQPPASTATSCGFAGDALEMAEGGLLTWFSYKHTLIT